MRNVIVLLAIALSGCDSPVSVPSPFTTGQLVEFVINGQRGQIVGRPDCNPYTCFYSVRVAVSQHRTNTRLFSEDDPIESYAPALVHGVRMYELRTASDRGKCT